MSVRPDQPPDPQRVLLVTDRYPPHPGGLARSSQRLAGHAASNGADAHVLVTQADAEPGSLATTREGSVWVHRLGGAPRAADTGQQAAQAIAWLHEQDHFDLIHGQYGSTGGFLAAFQARCLGTASYVSLRGNDLDRDVYDPARLPQLLWALHRADAVGGVSPALVAQARQLAGREDVRYTPNSVDGALFRPQPPEATLRKAIGLDSGPVIGFTGELRQKKGAVFLLEGFRQAAGASGVQLVIVGAVRPDERRRLEQFREDEPELAERLHLVDYVHDPAELGSYYALMDLVVCPALWEGMPNSVLEAMACGRPVLASDAGGLPELITAGETGWRVSRHRLHHLGEALFDVLSLPPAERLAVGERAREFVVQTFPVERERAELREAYQTALRAARSRC